MALTGLKPGHKNFHGGFQRLTKKIPQTDDRLKWPNPDAWMASNLFVPCG